MKIAIVGYGKMGKMIYSEALSLGHTIVSVIDSYASDKEVTNIKLDAKCVVNADCVIDFSSKEAIVDNILMYARLGIPSVIGTTGWHERIDEIKELCTGTDARILYSGNFSLGVAAFLKIAEASAKIFNKIDGYDFGVFEVHHNKKADSPSGTALLIANTLLDNLDNKNELCTDPLQQAKRNDVIQVSSLRVGSVPGFHEITIDSSIDTIKLSHDARSREGFTKGALKAAEWIVNKANGFYSMDDFINELLGDN